MSARARSLSDVLEETAAASKSSRSDGSSSHRPTPSTSSTASSPNLVPSNGSAPASNSRTAGGSKKTPSIRTLGRAGSSSDILPSATALKRNASTSSTATVASSKDRKRDGPLPPLKEKTRSVPVLPHDRKAQLAPGTAMYWSRAPVHGDLPQCSMRSLTVTLVDANAWLLSGLDDKEPAKDMKHVYCFDIETMQWSHKETTGDIPPSSRAHTATLVDRNLVVFGGGQGATYYDTVYVLDTTSRRWSRPQISGKLPPCRRAHTAVLYRNKIWIFGGGTGMTALNDVWTLDVSSMSRMRWEKVNATGQSPPVRGYHTANLVGNMMVVIGGSDAKDYFQDIWCLNLDTLRWTQIQPHKKHPVLAHTATQVGSYLFVMGGYTGSEYTSNLLFFNLVSLQYEERLVLGKAPSGRGYHSAILGDSRLFLFGGFNGKETFDDVYILDLAAGAYLPQVTSFDLII